MYDSKYPKSKILGQICKNQTHKKQITKGDVIIINEGKQVCCNLINI